jgi:hypothetical protein
MSVIFIKIIGFVHLLGMVAKNAYIFYAPLTQNNLLDLLYISFFFMQTFQWYLFNGECLISYLVKSQSNDVDDLQQFFLPHYWIIFREINHFFFLFSLNSVFLRSGVHPLLTELILVIYEKYVQSIQ